MQISEYKFDLLVPCLSHEIEIDTQAGYGCFERNSDGSGGGLWFERLEDGELSLTDYDGVTCLPKAVREALRAAGLVVDAEFE